MTPNIKKLNFIIDEISVEMKLNSMPSEMKDRLIDHILFKGEWQELEGIDSWSSHKTGLITKRELRNLILNHVITKISSFNKVSESRTNGQISRSLCNNLEIILFGNAVVPSPSDILDPWETEI